MKLNLIPVLLAGLLSAAPAFSATTVTIDFEGTTSFASILDYYNGGVDGGNASGANLGVSFGGDALSIANDDAGTYFSGNSSSTVMAVWDTAATMNVAAGFSGSASFSYSSPSVANTSVSVWSELGGTGTNLGTFDLSGNSASCTDPTHCSWSLASLSFSGVAKSITFGNAVGVDFDNITITAVPEPSEALMLALGLGVVSQVVRRARRTQASA
jgi:hypothetical protein